MLLPTWAEDIRTSKTTRLKNNSMVVKTCNNCYNDHWNLEVDFNGCRFHCWVCDYGGPIQKYLRDNDILYDKDDIRVHRVTTSDSEFSDVKLPDNRKLIRIDSHYALAAKQYLYSRGVTDDIIKVLDLRVAINEEWWGYIIYPCYGFKGLEHFVGIAFLPGMGLKYKFPEGSKDFYCPVNKNTVSKTLVLLEGFFDMTNVHKYTNYAVQPLLGKFVFKHQTAMIQQAQYDKVILALDPDAIKETLKLAKKLQDYGIPVYITFLPEGKDPDDCKDTIKYYLDNSRKYSLQLAVETNLKMAKKEKMEKW